MREFAATTITPADFDPFGAVLVADTDRIAPSNGRADAKAVVEMLTAPRPSEPARHLLEVMERHPHFTQTFFPLTPAPYLVVVAPDAPDGGPDPAGLRAFIVPAGTVVQYRPTVWHAPLTALGTDARLAMHIHKNGSPGDCEFVDIPPAAIRLEVLDHRPVPIPSFGETTHSPAPISKGDTVDAHE